MTRFAVELLVGQDVVFEWVGRASSECAGLAQAQHVERIMWRSWLRTSGIAEIELPLSLRNTAAKITKTRRFWSAITSDNLMREAKALLPSQPSQTIEEDQIDGFLEQLVWTDPLLRKVLQAGDTVWTSIEVSRVFPTRDLRVSAVVASGKNGRTLPDFSQQTFAALLALTMGVITRGKTQFDRSRWIPVQLSDSATLRALARVRIPVNYEPLLRFLRDGGHLAVESGVRQQAVAAVRQR